MFNLSDFFQLPQLKPYLAQLIGDHRSGVTILAGVDAHTPESPDRPPAFLPSGRNTFFETLVQQILTENQDISAVLVIPGRTTYRVPRELRGRVKIFSGELSGAFPRQISEAIRLKPNLLVVDRLDEESLTLVFQAARQGMRVITQLETSLWGYEVTRHLGDLSLTSDQLDDLQWILTLRRLPALCRTCSRPVLPSPDLFSRLRWRLPDLLEQAGEMVFYQAIGCTNCRGKGRFGDVLAFDVFSAHAPGKAGLEQASLLPLEVYLLQLAVRGYLTLEDLVFFEADQRKALYNLYASSQLSLNETDASLKRKLAELEAANLVLLKRTEVLISLQDTVQLLTSSASLEELAERVCQRARDMCGSDRAILYYIQPSKSKEESAAAQILAVAGWDKNLVRQTVPAAMVLDPHLGNAPSPSNSMPVGGLPPGYHKEIAQLQAGVQVPLIAQDERIGLMIIHSTQKKKFTPGETALLQTFASQAALAIQRAGLIEELSQKIKQLETAQAELLEKERLEHELELARQVQQSVLPKVFPSLPGYGFAARNSPARQVGGDFYDVVRLDNDHFGVIIADVSDKGMPAALYMGLTRSLLLAESRRSLSPKDVLTQVNQLLLELGSANQFVSVFYGVVNMPARRLAYTRAGHDRPLLLRQNETFSLSGSGAVLGVLEEKDLNLSQETLDLQPGDRLVLYTDGLIDVLSSQGDFYSLTRLQELLKNLGNESPEEICIIAFEEMDRHRQETEQFDDTTILVIEVKP